MRMNETAKRLYEQYAEKQPIIDYHNHLSAQELYENKNYASVTAFWLAHDHYKWQAMRIAGKDEALITGDASDLDKFCAWAETLETLVGSPLYAWTKLELRRLFGIDQTLNARTAPEIFAKCNAALEQPDLRPMQMLARFGVAAACTTNDPFEDLVWHQKLAAQNNSVRVLPTFRPDKLLRIDKAGWADAVARLAASESIEIRDVESLKAALVHALDRFGAMGCGAADQCFEKFLFVESNEAQAGAVLAQALAGRQPDLAQSVAFWSYLLPFLAEEYRRRDMVLLLRMGVVRDPNTLLFQRAGNDAGGDCIGDMGDADSVVRILDTIHSAGGLPRTILFGLNPNIYPVLMTVSASFAQSGTKGHVQVGVPWWFNDNERGIRRYLDLLIDHSLLAVCVGMLTDSRSVGSFVRHEYFRRILCDHIGAVIERGEYADTERAGEIVADICYRNAAQFFRFEQENPS